jgi:hypothetical protein
MIALRAMTVTIGVRTRTGHRAMIVDREMTALGLPIKIVRAKPRITLRLMCGRAHLLVAQGETSLAATTPAAIQTTETRTEEDLLLKTPVRRKYGARLLRRLARTRLRVVTAGTSLDVTIRAAMLTTGTTIGGEAMQVDRRKTGVRW